MGNVRRAKFNKEYKNQAFYLWYNKSRPGFSALARMLPPNEDGDTPTNITVQDWIKDWAVQADILDEQVKLEFDNRMIQEKIAMLYRHSQIGQTMQDIAIEYLNAHRDGLSSNSAVRMLVEGVRIERESRGITQALSKMTEQSEEELIKQIEDIISSGEIYEEPND